MLAGGSQHRLPFNHIHLRQMRVVRFESVAVIDHH